MGKWCHQGNDIVSVATICSAVVNFLCLVVPKPDVLLVWVLSDGPYFILYVKIWKLWIIFVCKL